MNTVKIALLTVNETRDRFKEIRRHLVAEETAAVEWVNEYAEVLKSEPLSTVEEIRKFAEKVRSFDPDLLAIHIPVWTEPVFTVKAAQACRGIPVVLVGNQRRETSSMVGLFGAGGAMDQVGLKHIRIFDHYLPEERKRFRAVSLAAMTMNKLRGMTYGCFGGRSLGMVSATADPAQWLSRFGIDTEHFDQLIIRDDAEKIEDTEIDDYIEWLKSSCMKITFNDHFTEDALRRQVASYLATSKLAKEKGLDFIGVKCQPELSDSYTTQCLSHMLCNGTTDAGGKKKPLVHVCEADADGALTMIIMNLISGGKSAALLDVRWRNPDDGIWTLANCGAMASDFASTPDDPTGFGAVEILPHVIGEAGSCGLPMMAGGGQATLARLCRKGGEYFMFIVEAEILERSHEDLKDATAEFPQAYLRMATDDSFFEEFGSNHLHMVKGNIREELEVYCELAGIKNRIWTFSRQEVRC